MLGHVQWTEAQFRTNREVPYPKETNTENKCALLENKEIFAAFFRK